MNEWEFVAKKNVVFDRWMGAGASESESTLQYQAMVFNKLRAIVVVISICHLAMIRRSFQSIFTRRKKLFFLFAETLLLQAMSHHLSRIQHRDRHRRRIKSDLFASIRAQ